MATPPKPSPPRIPLRDLPSFRSVGDVDTVSQMRTALRELENGGFTAAANLVDQMGRDDRIQGTTRTRSMQLLGLPLEFAERGDGRRKSAASKEVDREWWRWCPESALSELFTWGITLGVGVAEIVWTRGTTRWTPSLKVLHPQYLWWDWTKGLLQFVTQDGVVDVVPGDGRWVVFAPFGLNRAWMHGLMRPLAVPWLIRQWARRDWARHSEVHGQGIKKALVPNGASDEDKAAFFDSLKTLGSEGLVNLPQGSSEGESFDLELLEAMANTWEGFERLLSKCEAAITISVLGQNLTTEVQGGSRAASQTHDEVRQDLKEYDAEAFATCLHEHVLRPWALFNLGDADLAPYPCWDTEPPADEKLEAETLDKLGDAIGKLQKAGLQVDVVAMAEAHGVPLLSKELLPPKAPEPAPTPGGKPAKLSARAEREGGQAYVDAIGDAVLTAGTRLLSPDLAKVLKAIDEAKSFDELRAQLPDLLAGMDPGPLGEIASLGDELAELVGRRAVRQEP